MTSQVTNAVAAAGPSIYEEYLQGTGSGWLIRPSDQAELALWMADEEAYSELFRKAYATAQEAAQALHDSLYRGPMADGRRVFNIALMRAALAKDQAASAAAERTKSPTVIHEADHNTFATGGQSRAFYRQEVRGVLAELERYVVGEIERPHYVHSVEGTGMTPPPSPTASMDDEQDDAPPSIASASDYVKPRRPKARRSRRLAGVRRATTLKKAPAPAKVTTARRSRRLAALARKGL